MLIITSSETDIVGSDSGIEIRKEVQIKKKNWKGRGENDRIVAIFLQEFFCSDQAFLAGTLSQANLENTRDVQIEKMNLEKYQRVDDMKNIKL